MTEDHIMDVEMAEKLEDDSRYKILSEEELYSFIDEGETVVDVGSGTGFFTDDIAVKAGKVYAVDFQEEMHNFYQEKGIPENVELITSKASKMEVEEADIIISILSLHEINLEESLEKFNEILGENGRLIIVDWSVEAKTEDIPPREKLYTAEESKEKISQHFEVRESEERKDTFQIKAKKVRED